MISNACKGGTTAHCGLRRTVRTLLIASAAVSLSVGAGVAQQSSPQPIPTFDTPGAPAQTPAPQANATPEKASGSVVAIAPAQPNADGSPTTPLFQQAPVKATVHMDASGLDIRAKNSSLSQILREVSAATGMKVEGFSRDERVFGNFGPADPHQVLSDLLDGSGYNVIMLGDAGKGTPKVLSLSLRAKAGQPDVAPETAAQQTPTIGPNGDEDGEQMADEPADGEAGVPVPEAAPGPDGATPPDAAPPLDGTNPVLDGTGQPVDRGAESDGSPQSDGANPQGDTGNPQTPEGENGAGVRTPEQILQDLQRLHDLPQPPPPTPANPQ